MGRIKKICSLHCEYFYSLASPDDLQLNLNSLSRIGNVWAEAYCMSVVSLFLYSFLGAQAFCICQS